MSTPEIISTLRFNDDYYRSFVSYTIPFQPEGEIPFGGTEGLRSFYVGRHDEGGRIVRFLKIILVREDVREIELPENEETGSRLFFRVDQRPEVETSDVGGRIAYDETEAMTRFFEGEVGESGRNCRVTLFRKEVAFRDEYHYWPNGNLRERHQSRGDDRESVWHYDEAGIPIEANVVGAEQQIPGSSGGSAP